VTNSELDAAKPASPFEPAALYTLPEVRRLAMPPRLIPAQRQAYASALEAKLRTIARAVATFDGRPRYWGADIRQAIRKVEA